MKPGFHLWMLKLMSSQSIGCTHIHQTSRKSLNKRLPESWWQLFSSVDGGIHATRDHNNVRSVLRHKKLSMATQNKRQVQCSSMTMHVRVQLLALEHCWSISTGSCLTNLLTDLISLRATTTNNTTWRTGWDHSASTLMSWWKAAGFFDTRIQKLIPQHDKCFNSSWECIEKQPKYIHIFIHNKIIFLIAFLLTTHQRLLSEQPLYMVL
jgi:hypothetical protein